MVNHEADYRLSVELVPCNNKLFQHRVVPQAEHERVEPFALDLIVREVQFNPHRVGSQYRADLERALDLDFITR